MFFLSHVCHRMFSLISYLFVFHGSPLPIRDVTSTPIQTGHLYVIEQGCSSYLMYVAGRSPSLLTPYGMFLGITLQAPCMSRGGFLPTCGRRLAPAQGASRR